ncbi:hypothetical protein D3C80_1085480 [compost metagenome]
MRHRKNDAVRRIAYISNMHLIRQVIVFAVLDNHRRSPLSIAHGLQLVGHDIIAKRTHLANFTVQEKARSRKEALRIKQFINGLRVWKTQNHRFQSLLLIEQHQILRQLFGQAIERNRVTRMIFGHGLKLRAHFWIHFATAGENKALHACGSGGIQQPLRSVHIGVEHRGIVFRLPRHHRTNVQQNVCALHRIVQRLCLLKPALHMVIMRMFYSCGRKVNSGYLVPIHQQLNSNCVTNSSGGTCEYNFHRHLVSVSIIDIVFISIE